MSWLITPTGSAAGGSMYDLLALTKNGRQVLVRVATRIPAADAALAETVLSGVKVRS